MTSLNGKNESDKYSSVRSPHSAVENTDRTLTNTNNFLANVVSTFHGLVVLFVLSAPFFDVPYFLILHFTFCVSLLVHWWGNSNVCSLSVLESKLRGLNYTESFTHKFVAPIYDISKTTWSQICYVVTILLMCISAYKIYQSPKWGESLQCYNDITNAIHNDPKVKFLPLHKKLMLYFQCVRIVFSL